MQEITNKNSRLQNRTKHVGGVLHEKLPTIDDLQFDEDGRPVKFRNY